MKTNCKCNISYCTFTFVQLDSIHCVLMILEVSPEAGWKWKIFTESSVINVGGNYMILIEHHVMVKVNNISRFFRDEIEIFSNLVVRDEIEICFFYISCFETRSRICFTTSRISRRGRETKQLILEVEREFSMLILARHFEIENSRQCLPHWIK